MLSHLDEDNAGAVQVQRELLRHPLGYREPAGGRPGRPHPGAAVVDVDARAALA